ncbi:hypothetical protein [Celeribacter sp. SCSIO 80788]|jgi:hypothetical protein|uniref:hypothetical protein n=1 Tax=Celeribacter sp. SCSIO 80788 TaxID=3117013 RepID=UPI003DA4A114
MNLDRLISMIVNRFVRTLVNKGVNAGIDAGTKSLAKRRGAKTVPGDEMTPEQKADQARLAKQSKDTVQRAKKIARMSRRIGKF